MRAVLGANATEGFASDCALVVSELVANAAEHAANPASGTVDLTLELAAHGLAVTVRDSGTGCRLTPAQDGERGLGLRIVTALAHDYTITSTPHGTTVFVLVARPAPEER